MKLKGKFSISKRVIRRRSIKKRSDDQEDNAPSVSWILNDIQSHRQRKEAKEIVLDPRKPFFGLTGWKTIHGVDIKADEAKGVVGSGKVGDFKVLIKIVPIHPALPNEEWDSETAHLMQFVDDLYYSAVTPNLTPYFDVKKNVLDCMPAMEILKVPSLFKTFDIRPVFNVFATEFVEYKDMDKWVSRTKRKLTKEVWKAILFQIFYTLSVLQDKYEFVHRDCHPGNILMAEGRNKPDSWIRFTLKGRDFIVPDIGVVPKLWDFEYSQTKNRKCDAHLTERGEEDRHTFELEKYIDVHFLLRELLPVHRLAKDTKAFIRGCYHGDLIQEEEIMAFAKKHSTIDHGMYPETDFLRNGKLKVKQAIAGGFRLWTPEDLLFTHSFFSEYLRAGNERNVVAHFSYP